MNDHVRLVTRLLAEAGYELDGSPKDQRLVLEATKLLDQARLDPVQAVAHVLSARMAAEKARASTKTVMESVEALQAMLEVLLGGQHLLCRLQGSSVGADNNARASVIVGGQLREVSVHPDVDPAELSTVLPWHYVCLHPTEMVVVGVRKDESLFERAKGQVVEFLGYLDDSGRFARVSGLGGEERVVRLAPTLTGTELQAPARLVLQRDDEQWAIGVIADERRESRFEVSVESVTTRLEDLAGLDSVLEPMIEDAILRLVKPEMMDRHGIVPWRGIILTSDRPGQGKTAMIRAYARYLAELGETHDFEVALYHVKPGELKTVWHGGDAKLVREDLCGAIRARQRRPRTRPLYQLVVLDEIESLGNRSGGEMVSWAQNDVTLALLAEMDGFIQAEVEPGGAPSHVLWVGMTNRIDRVDSGLRRPGRFDRVVPMPEPTLETAEAVMAIYARSTQAWYLDGEIVGSLPEDDVRAAFLRPALAGVFDEPVLRYSTEGQSGVTVSAGSLLSNAHFEEAMVGAKRAAASRELRGLGVPAVTVEDVFDSLAGEARSVARLMKMDRATLARELGIEGHVTRVELLPATGLDAHRYLRAS